ncbi:MAG: ubiquinone biosynthesis protein [Gammaproteobacteria bacterium]|nr:ubiquinone biosynthesis protein [Gammaproteobacteria bacterium]
MSKSPQTPIMLESDVVISGGGPVGLMLAIGLAQQGQQVVLAEQSAASAEKETSSAFDGRVLALSHGSMVMLRALGVWQDLEPFLTEIHHVHVSQKGYLGITKLHAQEVGVPALGYSIQSSHLGEVLWQHINEYEKKTKTKTEQDVSLETSGHITVLRPASLIDFEMDEHRVLAQIKADERDYQVQAKLIVGADGTQSKVRTVLDLPIEEKSYNAFGVIAQIETEFHPENWSYERFTEQGPVALLPMQGHAHKAVLVCPEDAVEAVKALSNEAFITLFASKMGERLGAFTHVSPRVVYPLKETYVPQMAKGRALLMGNASHTQHPVAAQGLNLGIRDIQVFLEQMNRLDIGLPEGLTAYADARKPDHEKVMGLTDGLIQIFQHTSPVVGHLRGLGMMAMQAMPSVKRRFSRFAMGGQNR